MPKIERVTVGIGDNVMTGDKSYESVKPVIEFTVIVEEGETAEDAVSAVYPRVAALWEWALLQRLSVVISRREEAGRKIEAHVRFLYDSLLIKYQAKD